MLLPRKYFRSVGYWDEHHDCKKKSIFGSRIRFTISRIRFQLLARGQIHCIAYIEQGKIYVAVDSFLKTGRVPTLQEGNAMKSVFNLPWINHSPIVLGIELLMSMRGLKWPGIRYRQKHKNVHIRALKHWCRQILQGLLYLHRHDAPIIHKDLNCDNIFVNGNQGKVKTCDLGLAAIIRKSHVARCVVLLFLKLRVREVHSAYKGYARMLKDKPSLISELALEDRSTKISYKKSALMWM